MDMQAQAIALQPDENLHLATLAQDYAFGHDGIDALKAALEGYRRHIWSTRSSFPSRLPTSPR